MNGIKYIREKSNFTKNALAERMGVTRQTVTLWEKGVRKPDYNHLQWLCDFYGVQEKWFGELFEQDLEILNKMPMYSHWDGDKEYFTFVPDENEIHINCGELEVMLDEKYSDTLKKRKEFINRIDQYLCLPGNNQNYLFDKINTAERGMKEVNMYLDLMDTVQGIGKEDRILKVPFRYEIRTALLAMMIASGQYSINDVRALYADEFTDGQCCGVEDKYLEELADMMGQHWNSIKIRQLEQRKQMRAKKPFASDISNISK